MFPQVHGSQTFQAGTGHAPPGTGTAAPLPPPDPTLGDRTRNRDWAARDAQAVYEMRNSPPAHQFTNGSPHPVYGAGAGNIVSQYAPAHALARTPTGYSWGAGGGAALAPRPSFAYNRLVGAPRPAPTMYAWPSMYYPGGSNTYVPSWEATGIIIKYTRDPAYFRINKYVKEIKVGKDQGYYLALDSDQPYRVVSINDYLWEDSTDAPGGRQERQGFGFVPYRTARYIFPFSLGRKSVAQAEWPILAEHAQMAAAKAMTVRTLLATTILTTSSYWTGTWGTNYGAVSGAWGTSSETNLYIQNDLNTALITVEQASGGIVTDEDALQLVMNPTLARRVSASPEYRNYIKGSPDALSSLTDHRNPNRKYGLAPYLYGLRLVVENAVVVTTPKSGNVPSPPAQTRSYVWPTQYVSITSKPVGIVQADEQNVDFSTLAFRFYEQMTTEQKSDPDNRREVGRVVEDYSVTLQAPQTGFLFTGAS